MSCFYLYKIGLAVRSHQNPLYLISLFCILQFGLPLLARALLGWAQPRWLLEEEDRLISLFLSMRSAQPGLWVHQIAKKGDRPLFGQDLVVSQRLYMLTALEATSRCLSFLCNAVAVSALLHIGLLMAFAFSVGTVGFLLAFRSSFRAKLAKKAQLARNSLSECRGRFWDNIVLGNQYNKTLWEEEHIAAATSWKRRFMRQEDDLTLWSTIAGILAATPVSVAVLLIANSYLPGRCYDELLVLFMPQLPRIATITEYGLNLVTMLPRLGSAAGAFRANLSLLEPPAQLHLEEKIDLSQITIYSGNDNQISLETLKGLLQSGTPGFYSIIAPNGAGKSMLLLYLKTLIYRKTQLLPASHELVFQKMHGSTGEKTHYQIEESLKNLSKGDVLLLDEWDANLDSTRKQQVQKLLWQASQTLSIVEASPKSAHRFSDP